MNAADRVAALCSSTGWCRTCSADVSTDARGHCAGCGTLCIPPSSGQRIEFLTPGLWKRGHGLATVGVKPAGMPPSIFVMPERRTRLLLTDDGRPRWANDLDACRDCGRDDVPHAGHGRCGGCRDRVKREQAAAMSGDGEVHDRQYGPVRGGCSVCKALTKRVGADGMCQDCRELWSPVPTVVTIAS